MLTTPAWLGENPNSTQIRQLQEQFQLDFSHRADLVSLFGSLTDQEALTYWGARPKRPNMVPAIYTKFQKFLQQEPKREIFIDAEKQVAIVDDQPIPFQTPAEFAAFNAIVSTPVYKLNTAEEVLHAWLNNEGTKFKRVNEVVNILRKRLRGVGIKPEDITVENDSVGYHDNSGHFRFKRVQHVILDRTKYHRHVEQPDLDAHTELTLQRYRERNDKPFGFKESQR